MRELIVKILIGALLITSHAQTFATINCGNSIKRLLKTGKARMLADGEIVWGRYKCRSCGEVESMKPSKDGDVRCTSCGSPHTNEPDMPPAFFKKDGEVYIVDIDALMGVEDGKYQGHGLRDNCPFCETGHFANMNSCNSCGAGLENASDVFGTFDSLSRDARSSTSTVAITTGATPPPPRLTQPTEPVVNDVTAGTGEDLANRTGWNEDPKPAARTAATSSDDEEVKQMINLSPTQILAVGSAGTVGVITAGVAGYQRATETYTVTATVTKIERDTVYVSYEIDGQSFTIDLSYSAGKSSVWRMGEKVELYLIHWKGPQGAERGNGEVYPVNQD